MVPYRCVEESEGQAVLAGLRLLSNLYRVPIVLELYCSVIVRDLQAGAQNRSFSYPIISDIKVDPSAFASYQVIGISRSGNSLTHELAARARRHEDLVLLTAVTPDLQALMPDE